jgi:hypothetical protein
MKRGSVTPPYASMMHTAAPQTDTVRCKCGRSRYARLNAIMLPSPSAAR